MITDQAERLRKWVKRKELGLDLNFATFIEERISSPKRIIVFLGDNDEVLENSNLLANIAVFLTKKGKRTLILDAYNGKIDSSIPLGIHPQFGMKDILDEQSFKRQIVYTGAGNVKFVKISDILLNLDKLDFKAKHNFFNHWVCLEEEADIILINEAYLQFAFAVREVIIFTSVSGKTITSVYEKIKQLVENVKGLHLGLIVNVCPNEREAKLTTKRIISTAKRFLNADIEDLGFVLLKPEVVRALKAKSPFVLKYPYCPATHNVESIVKKILEREKIFPSQ